MSQTLTGLKSCAHPLHTMLQGPRAGAGAIWHHILVGLNAGIYDIPSQMYKWGLHRSADPINAPLIDTPSGQSAYYSCIDHGIMPIN